MAGMRLIVGLGNPGRQYAQTRHNVGFMVIARLIQRHGLSGSKINFDSQVIDGRILDHRCVLMQPMTYMNRSGKAVHQAIQFFQLEVSNLLVVVDDIALPCGTIRMRASGSAGGHNGLMDIESLLSTREYPRLRIGIDPPGAIPQADYVLGRIKPSQMKLIESAVERACNAVESWLQNDINVAMSRYNAEE